MSNPSKRKGYAFEKEVLDKALARGLSAERAWGSNGQAKGWHQEVDEKIEGDRAQLKSRKKLPEIVRPSEHVDVQIVKENRGTTWVIMSLDRYFDLLEFEKEVGETLKKQTGAF
jgi:hypothetical protein